MTWSHVSRALALAVTVAAFSACTETNPKADTKPMTAPATKPAAVATKPATAPAAVVAPAADPSLTHRYSFTTDAKDSVGKVDGTLKGGAKIANGALVLDNGTKTGDDASLSYLELASTPLPASGSVSIVLWITANNTENFARAIDFGDREGVQGRAFIYFTPKMTSSDMARVAITANTTGDKTYIDFPKVDDGKEHMVAIVIDDKGKMLHAIVDGKEAGTAAALGANVLSAVRPTHNWVGRSGFDQDPGLSASITELRIYNKALTADEAAALSKAGPDKLK